MEEQVQKRAGRDWNHGEPKSGASGECASSPRSWTLLGKKPEEWGQPSLCILCSVRKQCILEIPLNADSNSRSIQWDYRFTVTFIPPYLPERFLYSTECTLVPWSKKCEIILSGNAVCLRKRGEKGEEVEGDGWINMDLNLNHMHSDTFFLCVKVDLHPGSEFSSGDWRPCLLEWKLTFSLKQQLC